jgi:hypothetical protein
LVDSAVDPSAETGEYDTVCRSLKTSRRAEREYRMLSASW